MAEERRLVTVVFADAVSSTALGEALDPEDMRALLARFFAIARDVVDAHAGTIEKFIGDAVMVVFGLPQAHGDDVPRALSTALEIRDRVRADLALAEKLPIRLGVNTGEVIAARVTAPGDFLVTGDAVNIAARLQQVAAPWDILCGERTVRAASFGFVFGPAVSLDVKGKTAPVKAHSLLERRATVAARRVPLIGRERDLAHLELVAQRTVEERRPFVVSLIAPAGTGKTRLLEEFLDRLPALIPHATVGVAQCLPFGQRLSYAPLRVVLFRLIGIPEDAPPTVAREAIRRWVQGLKVDAPDRTAEFLAATVGVGETEVIDRDGLFAAWRAIVEALSHRGLLVIVFEDLHWSSDSLLDLVEFIMQPRGDSPVMMIALARPELLDRRPSWGGGWRNHVSLALEPLSDDSIARLTEYLLGGSAPEIVSLVVSRAEGNPFFAGEIAGAVMDWLPSLQDKDAVQRALAVIPDTIQATVLARLDLLSMEERRVLQLGSIFGRSFHHAGITALAPDLDREARRLIARLLDKDLIRLSESDRFTFRHILLRDIAYQTLPRTERSRYHAAAGGWLESLAPGRADELAELIAYHYREAVILSSSLEAVADTNVIRTKAVHWLSRAAEVARIGAAMQEAARHLRSAIELAGPQALPELHERLGDVLVWGGDVGVEAYRTALRLCQEAQRPPDQQLRVLSSLLTLPMRFGATLATRPSIEEMSELRTQGWALLELVTDERAIAAFLIAEAFYPFWRSAAGSRITEGERAQAETSVRRALEIAERLDDSRLLSAALDGLGSVATDRGDWADVRAAARRRLGFQDRLDLIERTDAFAMVAWSSAFLGDLDEAIRVAEAGQAILQPGQVPMGNLHLASWRIYALTLRGRWDEALALTDQACAVWAEAGVQSTGFALHGFVAGLDIARARQDEARKERCRTVAAGILKSVPRDSRSRAMRHYLTGELPLLEADVLRAFEFIRHEQVERSLSLCTDSGYHISPDVLLPIAEFAAAQKNPVLEAQTWRALGMALADPDRVVRALALFERVGAVPYAARAQCERALLTKDTEELEAGMHALRELGDFDQLARVERARAGG